MGNPAKQFQENFMVQESGIITTLDKKIYTVETHSGIYSARQAISCLIKPLPGDKVLVAGNLMDDFYILAILEREEGQKRTLVFHGDVDVQVKDGRLTVGAPEGMVLASAKDIGLVSSQLNIHSLNSEVHIHRLIFSGSFWIGQVQKLKLIVTALDALIERLSQRIKRSYRTVEDIDRLRAGRLDYFVDKLLSLRGKYSMFTAKEDVKIDAERIHMG